MFLLYLWNSHNFKYSKKTENLMGILDRFLSRNTLYYPGCLTKFVLKDIKQNYIKILTDLGIDFIQLKSDELCCGSPALNAGYKDDFENLMEKNQKLFNEHAVSKIITNCPACYYIFLNYYNIKIEHITETIWKHIQKLELKDYQEESITYHDPCHLGRHSRIFNEPRLILEALNFKVVELMPNKLNSICCGAGAGLKTNAPKLSAKIAKNLLSRVKTRKLITTCPMCYAQLKDKDENIEVLELSQVI